MLAHPFAARGTASGHGPGVSFVPALPSGGLNGWLFLTRTAAAQKKALAADPALSRDEAYFRDKIGQVKTADALIADRRLLSVALTAFGLEGDLPNKAFLKRIFEDGTLDPKALGNRLADKRYLDLSKAFGFGDFPVANTQRSDFADGILSKYAARTFESAVGVADQNLRLALNAQRELPEIAAKSLSADGKWYTIMGSAPLRSVIQTALGLPASTARIDIDRQLTIFKDRAEQAFGSADPAQFTNPDKVERLIRRFLARSDIDSGTTAGATLQTLFSRQGRSGAGLSRLA